MALPMETPSRIWRRIEVDAYGADMPSLPSLPEPDETNNDHSFDPSSSLNFTPRRPDVIRPIQQYLSSSQSTERTIKSGDLKGDRVAFVKQTSAFKQTSPLRFLSKNDHPISGFQNNAVQETPTDRLGSSTTISLKSIPGYHIEDGGVNSLATALRPISRSPSPIPQPMLDKTFDIVDNTNASTHTGGTVSQLKSFDLRDFKGVAVRRRYVGEHNEPPSQHLSSTDSMDSFNPITVSAMMEHVQGTWPLAVTKINRSPTEGGHVTSASYEKKYSPVSGEEGLHEEVTNDQEALLVSSSPNLPSLPEISLKAYNDFTPNVQSRFHQASNFHVAEEDDLATPLPRRKSFLLSVVNSSSRPKLNLQTPRFRNARPSLGDMDLGQISSHYRLPYDGGSASKLSRPLSQVIPETPVPFEMSPIAENDNGSEKSVTLSSTTSSHDLVLHRANASFDPATGPQGIGRFDASRLNSYLHGLNRRLQEENEYLTRKIKDQQLEIDTVHNAHLKGELSSVQEEAEQWALEKEELEKRMVELQKMVKLKEKEADDERGERMRDKELYKARMIEVEEGVSTIVRDLEIRLEDAEKKAGKSRNAETSLGMANVELEQALAECQLLRERVKQAEDIMANGKELGLDLRAANEKIAELERELRVTNRDVQRKESIKDEEINTLKEEVLNLQSRLQISDERFKILQEKAELSQKSYDGVKKELDDAQRQVTSYEAKLSEMSSGKKDTLRRLSEAEDRCRYQEKDLRDAEQQAARTSDEVNKFKTMVKDLERALEESDKKMILDGRELHDLKARISNLEQEKENLNPLERSRSQFNLADETNLEAMRLELDAANREIGNLKTQLAQSPSRKALEKAKEARIEMLEKENQQLMNQLRSSRELPSYSATPRKEIAMSGLSPLHRQLINLSLRTPITPGGPLRDPSWLMSMTGEVTTEHLIEEIGRLQKELNEANESIDDKIDKLEEAGLGVVGLSEALAESRRQVSELKARLAQYQERELRTMDIDANDKLNGLISKGTTSSLQLRLSLVSTELENLRKQRNADMASSRDEKNVLRDAANRLNAEVKRVKDELSEAQSKGRKAEKSKAELQKELTKAKSVIDDLEYHLRTERSRLQTMGAENSNALKEKDKILQKLSSTERKMEDTKSKLLRLKEVNFQLQAELRASQKAEDVEERLFGNNKIIDQLRQERARLSDEYFDLQRKLTEASKHISDLATKHSSLQLSYDDRRHQLDLQAKEIEKLREALYAQSDKFDFGNSETKQARNEGVDIQSVVLRLETELRRLQHEADHYGKDLKLLRSERDDLLEQHHKELNRNDRVIRQNRAQIRYLKEQLSNLNKIQMPSEHRLSIDLLRSSHKNECKGLFVQIRYLKAKFTRETSIRDNLIYQKQYLLVLLSRYEKSEKRILATIAQIDPLAAAPEPRKRSLKAVGCAIIFLLRARRAGDLWRKERSSKEAINEALESVRKRRLDNKV